jgi:pSer/pThr/pTyr-binding forkhead associated (FHA) protein
LLREPEDEEPVIIYPEEEQLILALDGGGSFAVRDGDVVGRLAKGADILERYPTVSRRHLSVAFREGRWYVKNLSTNGTYVNGSLVEVGEESKVSDGDELKLSSRMAFKVSL